MGNQRKLRDVDYRSLDNWLLEYQDIDKKIALRKLEIETSHETDVNVGGGRSNTISKPVENMVIKWDSDYRLKSLENLKSVVEELKTLLDAELSYIFKLRYDKFSSNSWEEIADIINKPLKTTYRKREKILDLFAEMIGR